MYKLSKKYCQIIKNKKHTIKNKTNKIGKRPETTYCLGCKDFTHNFRPEKVKMTNKVLREKSNRIVCRSNKSQQKIIFSNYKTELFLKEFLFMKLMVNMNWKFIFSFLLTIVIKET